MPVLRMLRATREARFLTQAELAERAGVSRVAIIRLESGTPARVSTARKLAAALGVEPGVLVGASEGGGNG